ncbi:MAG: CotH kinase family protein [Bacteroidota bacterium]
MNKLIPLFVTIFSAFALCAQSVSVNEAQYFVDEELRIILVNQGVDGLNAQSDVAIEELLFGDGFFLYEPEINLELGEPYDGDFEGESYTLYLTDLPIIRITTTEEIVNEPRRLADIQLVEPSGAIFESMIGVEYRGGFSQTYDKKSLRVELWEDEDGDDTFNESLLGMRSDDDWNLNAGWAEPLRVRNYVSWSIWRDMHELYYSEDEPEAKPYIDGAFVELFVDDEYRGLYQLTERMDRKQLKLKRNNDEDGVRGQLYKAINWGNPRFDQITPLPDGENYWGGWEIRYPDLDDENPDFTSLYDFTEFVMESNPSDFEAEIYEQMDLNSAVDYFIFLNIIMGYDNTGKNTFLARFDTEAPFNYLPWDLDGTFGNDWRGIYIYYNMAILSNCLFDRMLDDCSSDGFARAVTARWNELVSTGIVSAAGLYSRFVDATQPLFDNGVYDREVLAWPGAALDGNELQLIEAYIDERVAWLDDNLNNLCPNSTSEYELAEELIAFPNPTWDVVYLDLPDLNGSLCYEVTNMTGQIVFSGQLEWVEKPALSLGTLQGGIYQLRVWDDCGRVQGVTRIVKR